MTNSDLSKLKLDKTGTAFRSKRKIPRWVLISIGGFAALILIYAFIASPAADVETAIVARVYPSQSFTLLNASGYVVAQRKAAVASKATGRLEWLGVEEGNRVSTGQIIARLENRDVLAASDQAVAAVNSAKAELADAQQNYSRMKELRGKDSWPSPIWTPPILARSGPRLL